MVDGLGKHRMTALARASHARHAEVGLGRLFGAMSSLQVVKLLLRARATERWKYGGRVLVEA